MARKWRPQKFADVVGQAHIIKTLQNELLRERTAHAYLFVGPRGIGKTTIARIFAKALNCKNLLAGEPCCECSSCLAIAAGNNLDLIEIDGASNNSVEDVRRLREEVLYA
ncbi:MAG: AAA family ATPase, partial [Victivallales bacterium]|nr:AAA family ATPase [Victivallales bacterium]